MNALDAAAARRKAKTGTKPSSLSSGSKTTITSSSTKPSSNSPTEHINKVSSSLSSTSTAKPIRSKRQSIPGQPSILPPSNVSVIEPDTISLDELDKDVDDPWKELDSLRISSSTPTDDIVAPTTEKVTQNNSSVTAKTALPNKTMAIKGQATKRPSIASNHSQLSSLDNDGDRDSFASSLGHLPEEDVTAVTTNVRRSSRLSIEDMTKISEDRLTYQNSTNAHTLQQLLTSAQQQQHLQQPIDSGSIHASPQPSHYTQPPMQQQFPAQSAFSPPPMSPQKSKQDYFNANSADKYRSAMDIFNTMQNKPIVRIFFESYCSDEVNMIMDGSQLQALNYDLGIYVPIKDIHDTIEQIVQEDIDEDDDDYDDGSATGGGSSKKKEASHFIYHYFTYEDFLVYWRNHPFLRSMKLTDPLVKRRVFIASLYREVDILLQGSVKHVQFQKIYDALVDKDYINPKKYKFEDVIKRVDPTNKTKVEMNRFVAWMNEHVSIHTTSNLSTISRIVHSLIPGNSTSRAKSPQTTGVAVPTGSASLPAASVLQAKSTPATAVIAEKTAKPKPTEGSTRNSLDFRFLKIGAKSKSSTSTSPAGSVGAPAGSSSSGVTSPSTGMMAPQYQQTPPQPIRRQSMNRIDPLTLVPQNSNLPPRRASLKASDFNAAAMAALAKQADTDSFSSQHGPGMYSQPPPTMPPRRASLNVPQHSPFSSGGGDTTSVAPITRPMRRMSAAPPSMPPPPMDTPLSMPPLPTSPMPNDFWSPPLPLSPPPPLSPTLLLPDEEPKALSVIAAAVNSEPIPIYTPDVSVPSADSSAAKAQNNENSDPGTGTGKRVLKSSLARRKSVMKSSSPSSPTSMSASKGFTNTSSSSLGIASAALGSDVVGSSVAATGVAPTIGVAVNAGTSTTGASSSPSALSRRFPSLANRTKAQSAPAVSNTISKTPDSKDGASDLNSTPPSKSVNALLFAAVDDDIHDNPDQMKDKSNVGTDVTSSSMNPLAATKANKANMTSTSTVGNKFSSRQLPPKPPALPASDTPAVPASDGVVIDKDKSAKAGKGLSSLAKLKKTTSSSTQLSTMSATASVTTSATPSVIGDSADEKEKEFSNGDKEVITLRTLMNMRSLAAAHSLARKEFRQAQPAQQLMDNSLATPTAQSAVSAAKPSKIQSKVIIAPSTTPVPQKVVVESSFTPGTTKTVAVFEPPTPSRPSSPARPHASTSASSSPTGKERKFFRSLAHSPPGSSSQELDDAMSESKEVEMELHRIFGTTANNSSRGTPNNIRTFQEANEDEQEYILSNQQAFLGNVHAQLDVIMADMGISRNRPRSYSGASDEEVTALTSTLPLQRSLSRLSNDDSVGDDEYKIDTTASSKRVSPAISVVHVSHQWSGWGVESTRSDSPDNSDEASDNTPSSEKAKTTLDIAPVDDALANTGPQNYQDIIVEREKLFECLTWLKHRQSQAIDRLHEAQIASQERILAAAKAAREDCERTLRHLLVNEQVVQDMATDALDEIGFELKSLKTKEEERILQSHDEDMKAMKDCLDMLLAKKEELAAFQFDLHLRQRLPLTLASRDVDDLYYEVDSWRAYPQIYGSGAQGESTFDNAPQRNERFIEVEARRDRNYYEPEELFYPLQQLDTVYPKKAMHAEADNDGLPQYGSEIDNDEEDDLTAVYSLNTMIQRKKERENLRSRSVDDDEKYSYEDYRTPMKQVPSHTKNLFPNDHDDREREFKVPGFGSRHLDETFEKLFAKWN